MTRDEIVATLCDVLTSDLFARTITHDAFDPFIDELTSEGVYLAPAELLSAWQWFMKGWRAK